METWSNSINNSPGITLGGGGGAGNLGQTMDCDGSGVLCNWVPGFGWVPISSSLTDANGYYYKKMDTLFQLLSTDPAFLINPCAQLDAFYALANYQAPSSVKNRVDSLNLAYQLNPNMPHLYHNFLGSPFFVQNLNDAAGTIVNCDYFPVHISTLPTVNGVQLTAQQLMNYFRSNMNSFFDTSIANFAGYNDGILNDVGLWNSPNPLTALLHINMMDDGTVIVSQYYSYTDSAGFLVKTLKSPLDLSHPVSGNRTWRIEPDRVNGGYLFYTRAVDRVTTNLMNLLNNLGNFATLPSGFTIADDLWDSLQEKMTNFINSHGGSASISTDFIARPKWNELRAYLLGNLSLAELRAAYGCP